MILLSLLVVVLSIFIRVIYLFIAVNTVRSPQCILSSSRFESPPLWRTSLHVLGLWSLPIPQQIQQNLDLDPSISTKTEAPSASEPQISEPLLMSSAVARPNDVEF